MTASAHTRFVLPDELSAAEPPEARGLTRDEVRLLVATGEEVTHAHFHDLARFLEPGDLLVVNTSGTLPAAVDGRLGEGSVVVHFSTPLDDGTWVIELRAAPRADKPLLGASRGEQVRLAGGGRLTLLQPVTDGRLWRARVRMPFARVEDYLTRHGRPIRYGYVPDAWPLTAYQTVFALTPGSAEMPSAGRPFTPELVTGLMAHGVRMAPLVLHTGVSSLVSHESPQPERYQLPATTADLVNHTHQQGGRVIAVGTTVVRALESATKVDGTVEARAGWTDLVLGPDRPARLVDGLITGLHAPDASHLLLLEAVVGPDLVQRAYDAAVERRYLWHE